MELHTWQTEAILSQVWWRTPVMQALRRLKQENLHEFKASLDYRVSSRAACTNEKQASKLSTLDMASRVGFKTLPRVRGRGRQDSEAGVRMLGPRHSLLPIF